MGMEETLRGAQYRAHVAHEAHPDAELALGIESGFYEQNGAWIVFVVVVILIAGDEQEHITTSSTSVNFT